MKNIFDKFYLKSVLTILLLTGTMKIASSVGKAKILLYYDPIFGIQNKHLMIAVAVCELSLACYLLLGRQVLAKHAMISVLAINFLLYHIGLIWMGAKTPCPCLGNPISWWPWVARNEHILTWAIVLYLLFGGLFYAVSELLLKTSMVKSPRTSL